MKHKAAFALPDIGELSRTYAVVREIGRGGMGSVVLARHRVARHLVAIKIASAQQLDGETVARLSREANLMSRFRHPNIVHLYTSEPIGGGRVGIVMEYVAGESLSQLLTHGTQFSLDECIRIIRDVGQGLAHAHANGVVHRDLKPSNILIEKGSGVAKLADFGISKPMGDGFEVTATGVALGTPAYMSPEQIDGEPLDGRSDMYSLGLVAWEMLSGRRPWNGEPLFKLLYKQKHEELPTVATYRPGIPVGLDLAIEGALAKAPSARWQSVAQMLEQLDLDRPTPAAIERRARADALRPQQAASLDDATVRFVRVRQESAPAPNEAATEVESPALAPTEDDATVAVAPRALAAVAPLAPAEVAPPAPVAEGARRPREFRWIQFAGGLLVGAVAAVVLLRTISEESHAPAPARLTTTPPSTAPSLPLPGPVVATGKQGRENVGKRGRVAANRQVQDTVRPRLLSIESRPAKSDVPITTADAAIPLRGSPLAPLINFRRPDSAASAMSRTLTREARHIVDARGSVLRASSLIDSALTLTPRSGASYVVRARIRISRRQMRDAWSDIELAARTGARFEALALATQLRTQEMGGEYAYSYLLSELRDALTPRRTLDAERAVWLAAALAQTGDTAVALTILEQANVRDARMHELLADPLLDPIRRSERFDRVMRRTLE